MLWISVHLPHLAIELRQSDDAIPLAVTEGAGSRRQVIAANTAARHAGVLAGMDAPSCLLREPTLRLLDRSRADERRAMTALACWAHQFTSDVCMDVPRWMLWLEAGSSLRYFNGLARLYAHIREGVAGLGYTGLFGIAPTFEAAALLAKRPDTLPVLNRAELRAALASQPLSTLDIDPRVIDQLQTAGLRTLGELQAIGADALARRFGEDLPHYLQRVLGERADVRRRHVAPSVYRRRVEVEGIESVEGLLFPLRRLLQEFAGYLRGRDLAIQQLTLTLNHRGDDRTVLTLTTSAPQRDAIRLFTLLREKLERVQLPDAVNEVVLAADEFVEPRITQGDFFDDHQRENDNWSALLDKLRARLGPDAVRRLGLSDDHRPEHAWCVIAEGKSAAAAEDFPDRPLWFLREPLPLNGLPQLQLLGTPERIEAGWWAEQDHSRDYYLARTDAGARWWLFREADTHRWYLQGLWA